MECDTKGLNWRALGIRIKESRKRRGYTIEKLAGLIDVTSNFLARIEGNNARASLSTLYRIAVALDCGIDYLISDSMVHLSDAQILNVKTLNPTEQAFLVEMIKGLKRCEAEIIEQFRT
jgi:transcriptional regulator with XRE-family HTH domain